jgi:hypothetical protein
VATADEQLTLRPEVVTTHGADELFETSGVMLETAGKQLGNNRETTGFRLRWDA